MTLGESLMKNQKYIKSVCEMLGKFLVFSQHLLNKKEKGFKSS